MISAIVYTSETGFTQQYARMLSEETGLPTYSLDKVPVPCGGREIIYMGWLCAEGIAGYQRAASRYRVRAVCQVGISFPSEEGLNKTRKRYNIGSEIPVFALQGGLDVKKLHGAYRVMMRVWCRKTAAELGQKASLDEQQQFLYQAARSGASAVKRENLAEVIEWYHTTNKEDE